MTIGLSLRNLIDPFRKGSACMDPHSYRADDLEFLLSDDNGDGLVGLRLVPHPVRKNGRKLKAAIVHSLINGSPAARAGIKPRDVITSINGKPVSDRDAAFRELTKASWPIILGVQARCSMRGTMRGSARANYEQLVFDLAEVQPETSIGISFGMHSDVNGASVPTVKAVLPGSVAAQAGVCPFDRFLTVNSSKVYSVKQALALLKETNGPHRIMVGRPSAYHASALTLQRAWRSATGVVRIVLSLTEGTSRGFAFDKDISVAAVLADVAESHMRAGQLRSGHAVLAVDGKLCYNRVHAEQLIQETTGETVILCKLRQYVDSEVLRVLTPSELASRYSAGSQYGNECAICMQTMEAPIAWLAGCGHSFCAGCSKECRSHSDACPLCRRSPRRTTITPALLRLSWRSL
uniref:RING-type E3 ubiquitin transferase n=1 Tax=Chrysotila carterae TaxID=13221 RepID=A0A7S4C0M1_CHRCT|mmetsp:Transcript_28683/g.60294  ORF Transcript_28683/g.60294 Transcript_28683/m.60294 type:complete len:407 (+) Transcript_28683:124-1344(+)|eukprot:4187033-Pleurochrysis_carterae.AAC.2